MRSLKELVDLEDPGIDRLHEWSARAQNPVEILPPSDDHEGVLLSLQVTTRSTLGTIAYETGGVLIDDGWLRFRGSGNPRLPRTPLLFQDGGGFMLVADDAVGGFFAVNGGLFGTDLMNVYYWAPDDIEWASLGVGYTDFFLWSLSPEVARFYEGLRWPTWREDLAELPAQNCFAFYPFLWTQQGSVAQSHRSHVPIEEAFNFKLETLEQFGNNQGNR